MEYKMNDYFTMGIIIFVSSLLARIFIDLFKWLYSKDKTKPE